MTQKFAPENEVSGSEIVAVSPSGKYVLRVTSFATSPDTWCYTRGVVSLAKTDATIATVHRNYASFPASFIEGHPNGHDYLVCGEDYQGQTVIELDTGARRDEMSPGAERGVGFCWAASTFVPEHLLLVVDGCVWACPYEFRFYDFAEPMRGFPELDTEGTFVDADRKFPTFEADGTIRTYETSSQDGDGFDGDDGAPRVDSVVKTFVREGGKLVLLSEWISDAEHLRRAKSQEEARQYEAWQAEFDYTDPLYLTYVERLKNDRLSPSEYEGVGQTHEGWCPSFVGSEKRWCRRIVDKESGDQPYTIDLEWAVETGPVKLTIFRNGRAFERRFFEHSVEGMNAAFDYALALLA